MNVGLDFGTTNSLISYWDENIVSSKQKCYS